MLNVFLTFDTEFWPIKPDWRQAGLDYECSVYIDGHTPSGDYGLPYQLRVLNEHHLRGVFFVESLAVGAVGPEPTQRMVRLIREAGQEVQLHAHSEWLKWMDAPPVEKTGQHLRHFSRNEQTRLLAYGLENLRALHSEPITAFRAGNYGANLDTLHAVRRNRLLFDSSHNGTYLNTACDMRTDDLLLQPRRLHDVWEFPITYFRDWPGHRRHAQLCACSSWELEHALWSAWRRGWYAFVIVLHNFELLQTPFQAQRMPRVSRGLVQRFERLCAFLATHRAQFVTRGFQHLDPAEIPRVDDQRPLTSAIHRTVPRVVAQLMGRWT